MNGKPHDRGIALLAVVGIVAGVALVASALAPAPKGSGWKLYAIRTWPIFHTQAAQKLEAAQAKEAQANQAVAGATLQLVHQAHAETVKADLAAQALPPGRATDLTRRFIGNALGIYGQFDAMPDAERAGYEKLVADLLTENAAIRAAAERSQAAAETRIEQNAIALGKAQAAAAVARQERDQAVAGMQVAFGERDALATAYEAEQARHKITLTVAVLLLIGVIYLRLVAGKAGGVLNRLQGLLPAGDMAQVTGWIDGELSKAGQWIVRTGREAHAAAEAKERARAQALAPAPPDPRGGGGTA